MKREVKEQVGMVIFISKEDNILLKKHLLDVESMGVKITKAELASKLLSIGLHKEAR